MRYPVIYELFRGKLVANGESPHDLRGFVRFANRDTVHLEVETQDRRWGSAPNERTLVLSRGIDGIFRGEWPRVWATGVTRSLGLVTPTLALELSIEDEDGGEFIGAWIEDGKVLECSGEIHLPEAGRR